MKFEAPHYIAGHSVSLGSIAMANIGSWILIAHLKRKNVKKAWMGQELEKEGKSTDVGEGDHSLTFDIIFRTKYPGACVNIRKTGFNYSGFNQFSEATQLESMKRIPIFFCTSGKVKTDGFVSWLV